MQDFNILDFGARSTDILQTSEIQAALDACFLAGGGRVIIPCGIFYTGSIRVRSNTTLYLESGAILRGSRYITDYFGYREDKLEPISEYIAPEGVKFCGSTNPYSDWNSGLIKVINAENVSIIGERGSYIDGQDSHNPDGEEHYRGAHAINIYNSKNLYFEGYTITNSGNWAHNLYVCENIKIKNVTVLGGHDGFDVRTCSDITIEDCVFKTGDDAIAGFDNIGVVIRNCILDCACSALRFGGTNVLIESCKSIAPSSYGFRNWLTPEEKAKSANTHAGCRHSMHTPFQYYCDYRANMRVAAGNITVRNCEFLNPDAIFLHPFDGEHQWCCNRPLTDITFENCKFLGLTLPGVLCSDTEEPLEFRLKDCVITSLEEGADFPIFDAKNCKYIEFDNVKVEGFKDAFVTIDNPDVMCVKGGTEIKFK